MPTSSKYPWQSWTSTQAWRVQWLVDFECLPESFRSQVHMEAHRRELKAVTLILDGPTDDGKHKTTFVFFQFYERYAPWKPNLESLQTVRSLRAVARR